MACPTADMNDCAKKCKCVGGPCAGAAYDCANPCDAGEFLPSTCECFDASGTWRIVVTTYISPGGLEGYSDPDCGSTTPAVVTGVYKSDPDSGPNAFPWILQAGDYMYAYVDLTLGSGPDTNNTYFINPGTPDDSSNYGVKWNKTIDYYRGTSPDAVSFGSPLYVIARDRNGNIVYKGGSPNQWIETGESPCFRGPNQHPENPYLYAQGILDISYEKWNGTVWVPQEVPSQP